MKETILEVIVLIFPDYKETGCIYHIISIIDLKKTLNEGIKFDDKATYKCKYLDFHNYIDNFRHENIPSWVIRKKAIFGSMNFKDNHYFHSHTAVLKIKVDDDKCWVANENLANNTYEPFILNDLVSNKFKDYFEERGNKMLNEYWDTSLAFKDNLDIRKDKKEGYDAEVLLFHDVRPEDIEVLFIRADHKIYSLNDFYKEFYFN